MKRNPEFDSIIEMVEEQKKEMKLSTKLYRYTGLIQAIEFFSQKLNLEQIVDAAFEFINEILTLEKSALFVIDDNKYHLKKQKGYGTEIVVDANVSELHSLAKMHGTILYGNEGLSRYFGEETLEKYSVTALTPLIIDGSLYAFILMAHKTAGVINDEDIGVSEALMRLVNNALENFKRYEELQRSYKELDEKIFNLFAINQSSKALLSELEINSLYRLSVDVFSELTQSSVTGFVLRERLSDSFVLKAFKDVYFTGKTPRLSLEAVHGAKIDLNKIIICMKDAADIQYLDTLFVKGCETADILKAEYIVLLIKNGELNGFVSLGRTMTGSIHKASVFELIESLSSATYIAISNAMYIKQVKDQKKLLDSKLKKLISLNRLIKDINSALKKEKLLELVMQVLEDSFGVAAGAVALYENETKDFKIYNSIGIDGYTGHIVPNEKWGKLFKGNIVEGSIKHLHNYFDADFCSSAKAADGFALFPIFVDRIGIELLGVIMIFKFKKTPIKDEEARLTVETVASHIAPVMSNLITIEEQKRFSLPNYIELFKRDLRSGIDASLLNRKTLHVLRIDVNRDFSFKGEDALVDKLRSAFEKTYPFTNNNIFIILEDGQDVMESSLHRLMGRVHYQLQHYKLGTDFNSFQDFFVLFNK